MNRREFLKMVAATLVLGPSVLNAQKPFSVENRQYWASCLRSVWEMTTLHHRSTIGTNPSGEAMLVRNDLLGRDVNIREISRSLLFFGQITDTHILDEESPARVAAAEVFLEELGVFSAFHPQEDLTLQVLDSMFATLNQIHSNVDSRLDFVLNTGDSLDNAQHNELGNFLRIIEGGMIDPDSGTNEDPIQGSNNDANDPFLTRGLNSKVPYYTVIGNHDVLLQGNVPPQFRELYNEIAKRVMEVMTIPDPVGHWSNAVLAPWATPPDPHHFKPGTIIPDNRRQALTAKEFVRQHLSVPTFRSALGFPKDLPNSEYGYYSFYPKANLPIRVIVLDTALRLGTAIGAIHKTQWQDFLIPQLEDAQAKQELVIVASHHPGNTIKTLPIGRTELLSRYGRNPEIQKLLTEALVAFEHDDSYISGNEFEQTLLSYPNVFLHVAGHRHCHAIRQVGSVGQGYWEIQTASLLTYPQQARLLEIVYEGNNIGAIHTCVLDHQSSETSLAGYSRRLAYQDAHRVRGSHRWLGTTSDRNSILRFNVPSEIAKKLEKL